MKKFILTITLLTISNFVFAISANDFSTITSENANEYYEYSYTNNNESILKYLSDNKLISNDKILKAAIHNEYTSFLLNHTFLTNTFANLTSDEYNDIVKFVSYDPCHMKSVYIFLENPRFNPNVLIPGLKSLCASNEYGAVSYAFYLVKGETDDLYLRCPKRFKRFLDSILIITLEKGYKTLKYDTNMYYGYNNVVIYALRNYKYKKSISKEKIISKLDIDFYKTQPLPYRVYDYKEVVEYCNNIYLTYNDNPYVAFFMDDYYETSHLEKLYVRLNGEIKVKCAVYIKDLDKLIDSLNIIIPTNFSAKRINTICDILSEAADNYRTTEIVEIVSKLNKIYSPNLEKDSEKWEPVIAKIRSLIEINKK